MGLDWLWVGGVGLVFWAKLGGEKCGDKICQPLGEGSRLNLCAAGKRLAHNSSADEQRADLSTAEAKPHWFLPTCRIVSGITMKARGQTGGLSLFFFPFLLGLSAEMPECPCTLSVSAFSLQSSPKEYSCSHNSAPLLKDQMEFSRHPYKYLVYQRNNSINIYNDKNCTFTVAIHFHLHIDFALY